MPKGDCVMRRRIKYDAVTTARTNQCSISEEKGTENKPRRRSAARLSVSLFSPPVRSVEEKMMTKKICEKTRGGREKKMPRSRVLKWPTNGATPAEPMSP